MRLPSPLRALLTSAAFGALAACAASKEEPDNGGDHVPDDYLYYIDAVPTGAELSGLAAQEVGPPFFRKFVAISDHYYVCLDRAAFDDKTLTAIQSLVAQRTGAPRDFGLEGIVNHVLATVDRFRPGAKPASSRIEVDLVRSDTQRCQLLVTRAPGAAFPFSDPHFVGATRVFLNVNQLRGASGVQNHIPVAYVQQSVADADLGVAVQYLIGRFFGLGESALDASELSAKTDAETPGRGWLLEDQDGVPRVDDDAQILYGFALLYRDVLKATDLATFHHYQDQINGSDAPQDPDLVVPAGSTDIAFADAVGDAYLTGVRLVGGDIKVCVVNVSGVAVAADRLPAYVAFAAPTATGSVTSFLHDRDVRITATIALADTGCNLLVYLKNTTQYPFATSHVNGLYAHEGTLKTKTGERTTVPVIYLNASALELDPAAQAASTKPLTLVLQHEFAHFLGFRHSTSNSSILSPAGYNPAWDLAGGDARMFDDFVTLWKARAHP